MKPKKKQLWNLVYIVNGKVKETLMQGVDKPLAKWKASQLKLTSHKMGLLTTVKHEA